MVAVLSWIDNQRVLRSRGEIIDTVFATLIWVLWTYRNNVMLEGKTYTNDLLFDLMVMFSFNWFCFRNCKSKRNFTAWLRNPLMN